MKSIRPPLVAMFFYDLILQNGVGVATRSPLDPLLLLKSIYTTLFLILNTRELFASFCVITIYHDYVHNYCNVLYFTWKNLHLQPVTK